jgi:hypothetical protein
MPPYYRIKEIDESGDGLIEMIVLVDVGPWDKHQTITNNPDYVIRDLREHKWLTNNPRVLYYDSEGCMDAELLYDENGFVRFKHLPADQCKWLDK